MKKITLIAIVFAVAITSHAQKKKNGAIYVEHPAITVVEAMQQAFIAGDVDELATYLSDDFKEWNGSNVNRDSEGTNREQFLENATFWHENISYLSIKRQNGAYPDAIEYKDDEDGIWVQTWDVLKGVHSETGTKINMPIHRLFGIDKDNKINVMISYYNDAVFAKIGPSYDERKNGVIYDNHEHINTVKIAFAAFENNDLEKAYSVFAEGARFRNLSMVPGDESATLDDIKARNEEFFNNFEIVAIDMNGYPDLLHYERGNTINVQSWWTFRLIRKSDDKKINVPAMYTHTFNEDGEIVFSSSYFNSYLLDQ